jgi:hypothetical protein
VVLATSITALVSPVGGATLLTPDSIATTRATVSLAAIAADADREHGATFGRTADPHSQDRLAFRSGTTHLGIIPDADWTDDSAFGVSLQ